jgi:hypothetical protein
MARDHPARVPVFQDSLSRNLFLFTILDLYSTNYVLNINLFCTVPSPLVRLGRVGHNDPWLYNWLVSCK